MNIVNRVNNDNDIVNMSNTELCLYYKNRIYSIVDEFKLDICNSDDSKVKEKFRYLVIYIADRIPKVDLNNLELLDMLFNLYCGLCYEYGRNPTVELFGFMVGLYQDTKNSWLLGGKNLTSAELRILKKWQDVGKSSLLDDLENSSGTSVNKIFIAKAKYGLTDQPQPKQEEFYLDSAMSLEQLANELDSEINCIEDKHN